MSWISRPDRMWSIGGVLAAAVLFLVAWTFLIAPQRAETDELATNTEQTLTTVAAEQRKLDQLRREYEGLAGHEEKLASARRALPTEAALADFLRQLHAAETAAGVAVIDMNATGGATQVRVGDAELSAISISLTVEGSTNGLAAFLNQLQQVQPRAALILNTNLAPGEDQKALTNAAKLSLTAQVFVAPAATTSPSASASPAGN